MNSTDGWHFRRFRKIHAPFIQSPAVRKHCIFFIGTEKKPALIVSLCCRSSDQDQPATVRMSPPAWLLGGSGSIQGETRPPLFSPLSSPVSVPSQFHSLLPLACLALSLEWERSDLGPIRISFWAFKELRACFGCRIAFVDIIFFCSGEFFVLMIFWVW